MSMFRSIWIVVFASYMLMQCQGNHGNKNKGWPGWGEWEGGHGIMENNGNPGKRSRESTSVSRYVGRKQPALYQGSRAEKGYTRQAGINLKRRFKVQNWLFNGNTGFWKKSI